MAGIKDAKCVLVIGATSDIGGALALAIHDLDSMPTVIVAGQRQERLDELAAESDRIKTARVDTGTSYDKLSQFVEDVVRKYPDVSLSRGFYAQSEVDAHAPFTLLGGCCFTLLWNPGYLRLREARDHRRRQ